MLLPRFLQDRCQPIPSQGIVGNCQQITQTQAAAVAHQDPCRQQDSVRAMQRTPRHLCGYRKQVPKLVMGPSADHRKGVLDTADRPCTIVHQEAVAQGGSSQGGQHPSMIVNRGGGEMTESIRQVGIDVGDSQLAHPPGEAFGQDDQLLAVAGTSSRPESIVLCKLSERHAAFCSSVDPVVAGEITPSCQSSKPFAIFSPHNAPLAQLDRVGRSGPLHGWLSRIIRGVTLALLAVSIFLNGVGTLLTLLALGQLGRAAVHIRRSLRKDSVCPTDGAFFKGVYK